MNISDVLQEFKRRLEMVYEDNLKDIILFGSRVRGDFTEESDIDILVLLGNITSYEDEFNKIFRIQREIERKYDDRVIISSTLAIQDDYNSRLEPLYLNIRKEGVSL
ncbi:MAG: nucleotidyltransferase domain-containing protein [Deltaproteobacteria bacterium]|nr:nucleotidyltransferase domain-containing protein [Deltaproteobacteria bacterium]